MCSVDTLASAPFDRSDIGCLSAGVATWSGWREPRFPEILIYGCGQTHGGSSYGERINFDLHDDKVTGNTATGNAVNGPSGTRMDRSADVWSANAFTTAFPACATAP